MKMKVFVGTVLMVIGFIPMSWGKPSVYFCSSDTSISALKFLAEYDIPYNMNFKGTTVGGLSGIDYDRQNDVYYFISDDRSAINPVRYYSAAIKISKKGIDTVEFLDVRTLLQPTGKPYPSIKEDPTRVPDPEAIRYNAKTKQLIWTSEGERNINAASPILVNPSISIAEMNGTYASNFETPENLIMNVAEKGPRQNGTLEGLALADNYNTLYVSMEEPLYEDGPRAGITKTDSWIRIFRYDVASKKNIAQYAYALEPVAKQPNPENAFKVNGISEILSLGKDKLLVVERSFSTGHLACVVKIFEADLASAQDVASIKSLTESPPKHPVSKKLLLNMDQLSIYIDNIEGVTFGPNLPNGHKTLLFVSDNNFIFLEKMQVLLFEVIPN